MGKIAVSIQTLFVLCCIIQESFAAQKIDAKKRALETKKRREQFNFRRGAVEERDVNVRELLDLSEDTSLSLSYEMKSAQGLKVQKLRETYKGIPVYDSLVAVARDEEGKLTDETSGYFIEGIEDDLKDPTPKLSREEALTIAMQAEGDGRHRKHVARFSADNFIYIDEDGKAISAYVVNYFLSNGKKPKRPSVIVDAQTGQVIRQWANFQTWNCGERLYKAYGGNEKMGKIKYGNSPYCLQPTIQGNTCILENKYVRVIDMESSSSDSKTETANFTCKNGYTDEVNGAYSPIIDAFFYGTMVGKMFEDWYHSTPLREKVVLRVHYGTNMENAFWDGNYCSFGDGDSYFYPLTSLDVVSHEIGHGVTEQSSGLVYSDESGGLNEAFSDIMGEAAEVYTRNQNDMVVGFDITKEEKMRDFRDPEEDGNSVGHVDDFHSSMDPHYSSGVYRRVFYVLIRQKSGKIRPVSHAFVHANRMYWHENIGFQEAGCGLLKAAYDLGQNPTPYVRALNDVGVRPCDVTGHIRRLRNHSPISNIRIAPDIKPLFGFEAPDIDGGIDIETSSAVGENVQITVRVGTWENDREAHKNLQVFVNGTNSVTVNNVAGDVLFIELSAEGENVLNNVTLIVGHQASSVFKKDVMNWFNKHFK